MKKLFSILQRPCLWQRSSEPFWDDGHISKGMLEAHLDPDRDSASRKPGFIDRSVEWLSGLVPAGGKILDLGCGPSLYARRLSRRGFGVTGIDLSKRSIAYATSQDPSSEYICGNYLELTYTDVFDAALLIYCDYAALTPDERGRLAGRVHRAIKTGGLFILDVFTEKRFEKRAETSSWTLCDKGGFWSPDPYILLEATHLYEKGTVTAEQYVVVGEKEVKEYLVWDTAFTVRSLSEELCPHGFRVKAALGDVCGSPYPGQGDTLCLVLEKEV